MNFISPYTSIENNGNNWHQLCNPTDGSVYYWNEETKESTWSMPKKVKYTTEVFLPVENFISPDKPDDSSFMNHLITLPTVFDVMSKCNMCNTQNDVKKHGYCKSCYDKINSSQEPLILKHKIKCQGCHGWGINLVKDNGFCGLCSHNLKNGLPIKMYQKEGQMLVYRNTPQFPKCRGCGGWGKDLVKENGKCDYCTRKELQNVFEATWKTKCKTCGGWGLELVKDDGLCNHCRRMLAKERIFFSKVLNQKSVKGDPNIKWTPIEDSLLGKRPRNKDDSFEM